jgi:flagellar hook-associated protein 2
MSDITIPGVTNKYNTTKIIADTMKLERIPLTRLENRVAKIKKEKTAWADLNNGMGNVRTSAQALYSFNNPFEDKVVDSSNSTAITGTATRAAHSATDRVTVKQIATADSFLSSSLPDDFNVPAGDYGFGVGQKELSFQYGGGSVKDFVRALNQKASNLLTANVINNTATTQVVQVTAKDTGAANKLTFRKDSRKLGVDMGFLRRSGSTSRNVKLSAASIQPWTKPLSEVKPEIASGKVTLNPGGEISVPISPPVAAGKNLVLEVKLKVTDIPHGGEAAPTPPPGPSLPSTGSIEYQGVKIRSQGTKTGLPLWQPPSPPKIISDLGVLSMLDGTNVVQLPPVKDTQEVQTLQFPLNQYVQNLNAVDIRNPNTYRKITIEEIKVYNPNARGQYSPVDAVSKAGDALLNLDGIEVQRSGNTIDDVIPGVTLNLNETTSQPVTIDIHPDIKKIKDAIITFVGNYNKLLTDIVIYTGNDPKVIDEVSYFNSQQRQDAQKKLGMFQGDITLAQIKSRLQEDMMNRYRTAAGSSLDLLAQIGISTNVSKSYSGFDISKLRGYLEIDENRLDQALKNNLQSVKDLFGYDSTGDLVINTGAAYEIDRYLKAFNQTGGIIAMKEQSYDQSISQTNHNIDSLKQKLAQKEQALKNKYAQMEGAISTLQENARSLQSLRGYVGGGGTNQNIP